jgi:hypothetical protein
MSGRIIPVVALALAAALLTTGQAGASDPSPDPSPAQVWLKGPFGRVPGGSVEDPATAAPDGQPLDAWMRRAPLELSAELPAPAVAATVVARALDGAEEELLSHGAGSFSGPEALGKHVIVATFETPSGGVTEHAWLVDVPDRSGGPELLWEIPGPRAVVGPAGDEVLGVPGHGCYAYLCVEAGLRPPVETLESVRVAVGEAPALRIDDGSAVVHWQGRLEPVSEQGTKSFEAEATFAVPTDAPVLAGLEPTAAGEWLLEVRVDYDRERGWQWFLFKLLAE